MTLWIARHPPVIADGICYGRHDVPTSIAAEEAATLLEERLASIRFDIVCASPLSRARDVAEVVASRARVSLAIDARLAELSMGEWEGRRWKEIEASDRARFDRWMAAWETESPPGGETIAELHARVDAWVAEVKRGPACVRLVVAHSGVIRAMRARATRIAYAATLAMKVEHLVPERFDLDSLA